MTICRELLIGIKTMTTLIMNRPTISFSLEGFLFSVVIVLFFTGCSSTPKVNGVAITSQNYWNTAAKAVDQEDCDRNAAAARADKECTVHGTNWLDREACYKLIFQTGFISKAVYPEYARQFVDATMRNMVYSWTGQITPVQLKYMNTRLLTEYTLARNNAVYARMNTMLAQESTSSSRWAEIAAGAATSIGTAAALSQPQFTEVPPIVRQPYWMYQGGPYQDTRRDEYHMHPGVQW